MTWQHWLDALARDVRHAVRRLRRSPGLSATVVIVLAASAATRRCSASSTACCSGHCPIATVAEPGFYAVLVGGFAALASFWRRWASSACSATPSRRGAERSRFGWRSAPTAAAPTWRWWCGRGRARGDGRHRRPAGGCSRKSHPPGPSCSLSLPTTCWRSLRHRSRWSPRRSFLLRAGATRDPHRPDGSPSLRV